MMDYQKSFVIVPRLNTETGDRQIGISCAREVQPEVSKLLQSLEAEGVFKWADTLTDTGEMLVAVNRTAAYNDLSFAKTCIVLLKKVVEVAGKTANMNNPGVLELWEYVGNRSGVRQAIEQFMLELNVDVKYLE